MFSVPSLHQHAQQAGYTRLSNGTVWGATAWWLGSSSTSEGGGMSAPPGSPSRARQPLQDEWMNELGFHPRWITGHLQSLWLCSISNLHRKVWMWLSIVCLCVRDADNTGETSYFMSKLPFFRNLEKSLHQEDSAGWHQVLILQTNWSQSIRGRSN